jgi:hypothetical protein
MAPAICDVHALDEAHAEYSPVGPFRVEERDLAIQEVIAGGGHNGRCMTMTMMMMMMMMRQW